MSFHRTEFIDNTEVRPGAEWRQPAQKLIWHVVARCEAIDPMTFTAGVYLGSDEMARTSEDPSLDAANRAANDLLRAAMRKLFSDLAG